MAGAMLKCPQFWINLRCITGQHWFLISVLVKPVIHCGTFIAATTFPFPNLRFNVSCCNNGAATPNTTSDSIRNTRETNKDVYLTNKDIYLIPQATVFEIRVKQTKTSI